MVSWDRRRGPLIFGRSRQTHSKASVCGSSGVLLQATENDLESEARVKAFLHGLEQLGWTEGRNLKLEYRWAGGNSDDIRKHAAELVAPSRRISSWRLEAQQSGLCSRQRVLCRSYLRLLAIRSVPALSKA